MNYKYFFVFMLLSNIANAHYDDAYDHSSVVHLNNKWMKNLNDELKIDTISIPGTHNSASFYGGDMVQTQSKSISNQLDSGVRFLDIRLRHENDALAIYHGFIFQYQYFDGILNQVKNFLYKNPSEFILMRVQKEHTEEGNTRAFEDTFLEYVNKYSDVIYVSRGNSYFPSISEVRGKIVFLDQIPTTGKHPPIGIKYSNFKVQDAYNVSTNWGLYEKWEKVKKHLIESSHIKSRVINYLSASGGAFPYFIASGHSSNGNSAPRLGTGLTTPGWKNTYPDFPRVNCFIGICTIAFEGTNTLTKNWIIANSPNYTGIIAADFIGPGLISAIINTNFKSSLIDTLLMQLFINIYQDYQINNR